MDASALRRMLRASDYPAHPAHTFTASEPMNNHLIRTREGFIAVPAYNCARVEVKS